jgi:tetratricopeptide (TPR) repeat protein
LDPNSPAAESLNARTERRIPASRQARLLLVVAIALGAGLVTGGALLVTRSDGGGGGGSPDATAHPLKGRPPLVIAPTGVPDGLRRRVTAIIRSDDAAHRTQAIAALRKLPQDQPVVVMALGLAQLWAGDVGAAQASLEKVKALDPYGFYGTNADNLLHINREARGYPPWVSAARPRGASVADLRARTRAHPSDASAWLGLAAALERTDRVAAIAAAKRALALEPADVSARVAALVLPFDKDNPMLALNGLRDVVQEHPGSPEAVFHLGLVYYWLLDDADAQAQFRQVISAAPNSAYGQIAAVFSHCIDSRGTCKAAGSAGSSP